MSASTYLKYIEQHAPTGLFLGSAMSGERCLVRDPWDATMYDAPPTYERKAFLPEMVWRKVTITVEPK